MKKIFAIFALFLAFSFSANAQATQAKPTPDKIAAADLAKLTQFIRLSDSSKQNLNFAFYDKNKALTLTNLSDQDKASIKSRVENELAANLTPEELQKLKNNTKLYEALIN